MNDKEIIEICGEICNLELADINGEDVPAVYEPSVMFPPDILCPRPFNPLTDANDERLVLEAMREHNKDSVHNRWLAAIIKLAENCKYRQQLADWLLNDSKVGDIARAAAKAWKETND